jgi:secreted PhoX family phosphatase
MQDGLPVPDKADGTGCFAIDDARVALVRNHELAPYKGDHYAGPELSPTQLAQVYDSNAQGNPIAGGTSNIIYNLKTQQVEHQCMSLLGTIRNCAGGKTPWNTWLTCEETVSLPDGNLSQAHGYVFEVPANAKTLVDAKPITAMGRFNHEAACIDSVSGVVYLTEDRHDSLNYRLIPNDKTNLHAGGRLQALAFANYPQKDTRNWEVHAMAVNRPYSVTWVDLDEVDSPNDDLRARGHEQGAALFARGEGIVFGENEGELYFCCTNGGPAKAGQIMRYTPSPNEGTAVETSSPGTIELFVQSPHKAIFDYGDNIEIAPNGHLIVCEDQSGVMQTNHIKGVTPTGHIYNLAKVRWDTEPAGVCFSPDGSTLFVNLYSPTRTLAITGPWSRLDAIT